MRWRILETRNAFWSGERRRMQLGCGDKIDDVDFQSSSPGFAIRLSWVARGGPTEIILARLTWQRRRRDHD
jgi:hypothetical protein